MKSFMKIKLRSGWAIVCLVCAVVSVAAAMEDAAMKDYAGYPKPDEGCVTDIANLLTDAQEAQLEGWLYDCEKEKGVEVAVVTIGSISDYPGTANSSVEAFVTGLFDTYGIGNMPKNDGVLLLVSVNDREARIELGAGYDSSRDAETSRIMQNVIVPQFRNSRYDRGILNGVQSLLMTFAGMDVTGSQTAPLPANASPVQQAQPSPAAAPVSDVSSHQTSPRGYTPAPVRYTYPRRSPLFGAIGLVAVLFMGGLVVMVIVVVLRGVSNRGMSSHHTGMGFGSRSIGGFGGGFGGGFSGGSHSSFGGGFSGGGGATGKW